MAEEKEWKGQKRTAAFVTFREVINVLRWSLEWRCYSEKETK